MSKKQTMLDHIFKDKSGKVVIAQRPNWPIWIILFLSIASRVVNDLAELAGALITILWFYWGYMEITAGANYYRRFLGVLAIGLVIYRLLQ